MRSGKGLKLLKRFVAIFIVLEMFLSIFPLEDIIVYAFDQANYNVTSVTVFKVYDSTGTLQQRKILIQGSYLKDSSVGIITSTGYQALSNPNPNSDTILQFDMGSDQLGNSIQINSTTISLDEALMPTITGVTRKVRVGVDDLYIQGTKLNNVGTSNISASFEQSGVYVPIASSEFTDDTPNLSASPVIDYDTASKVRIKTPNAALGLQNIIFQKDSSVVNATFGTAIATHPVPVTVKYTYQNQTTFVKTINVSGLQMHPNRGIPGDMVFFEAPNPNLDNYDVFFLKATDGTDPYSNSNKGTNKTFKQNVNGTDILTVQVPNLPVGDYFVVLTNPIPSGANPATAVVQEEVLTDKFTVIDSQLAAKIAAVQPNSGPDTGSKTTITGQFLISLNVPEFKPSSSNQTVVEDIYKNPNAQQLLVDYGQGTYNGVTITSAQRKVNVIIGSNATFLTDSTGTKYNVTFDNTKDTLVVQTPQVTDADVNPVKDVVVETETTFTKSDGSTIIITERAALTNGYTYIPSNVAPSITDIIPNQIEVVAPVPSTGYYVIPQDMIVAIHGKNFMITKYTQADGTQVTRYPVVGLGPDITLDKNTNSSIDLHVFDASGNELDGTSGNEIGTKILVKIPAGTKINLLNVGKTFVSVINPMRNSNKPGYSDVQQNMVEFDNTDATKIPVITDVTPSVEAIGGGDTITISGSNFEDGVKVFLDGEQIQSITRQGDGKKITFTCPKGREGQTQIEVLNPEGGIAIAPFTFVKTYTDPKITDFSPKKGNTGTLVIITGNNFLKPDPTSVDSTFLKLIGTRVLLGGTDINQYNIDQNTKAIKLVPYTATSGNEIIKTVSGAVAGTAPDVADYYYKIILQDASSGHYYTIDEDVKGNCIISDGAGNDYTIQLDGNGGFIANKKNGSSNLTVTLGTSTLTDGSTVSTVSIDPSGINLKLNILTAYKIDSKNNITGCNVHVMDINHIYFWVPILNNGDGYYDVTVLNPDTKKDSKVGTQGFYYYGQPVSKPTISSIIPSEGSTDGGYLITINGSQYEDNGVTKSRVFINGVEVAQSDITVSTDGKSMDVKVPKYPGDLIQDHGTSRYTVPVVIVNSDGGSVSKSDGFTYVVPGSHPQIIKIVPQQGSAAGGDIVEITGTDFRYFEPYNDANRNQQWDTGEDFTDLNGNGLHDDLNPNVYTPPSDLTKDLRQPTSFAVAVGQYAKYYASPILPKVYFGDNLAKIVEYANGYIKVVTPAGTAGTTKVYVVNDDSGISNTVNYTYVSSSPKITSILPSQGNKQGGEKVEIDGTDFEQSSIDIYGSLDTSTGTNKITNTTMPLVRFGSIDNTTIDRDQPNGGRIDNGLTTVALAGGLTVGYDATGSSKKLSVTIQDNGVYTTTIQGYDDSVKYIPVNLLYNNGTQYSGHELIRVEVSDRRLIVERGFSPSATYTNSEQVIVYTPSYYSVGVVTIALINPDGGTATGQFEYKNPSSNPSITDVTRDSLEPTVEKDAQGKNIRVLRMNYKGGSIVSVFGTDFRENAQIQISNIVAIAPSSISYSLPTKLTFTMPAVPESAVGQMYRVIVTNTDGGTAVSDPDSASAPNYKLYIIFTKGETSPAITSVTPNKGPASGGTTVVISGSDFRGTMDGYNGKLAVYFGETKVSDSNVTVVDYKTIKVTTPAGTPGTVSVRVENPDGEESSPNGTFTYLSSPQIIAVVDPTDSTENTRISSISVVGGETIKIKGSGFMTGARVVFNPTKVDSTTAASGSTIYINGVQYILSSGTDGSNVVFIDSETIDVTTPAGKLGTSGIMVINPDGGASEIFGDLVYGLPKMGVPTGVTASLEYDRYIKINWTAVSGATEYEIYAIVDGGGAELIGSTQFNSFVYSDIEPDTSYKFIVKAVGNFGSSEPSEESNTVDTGSKAGPPDNDGKLTDNTQMTKSGDGANVTIGENDFDSNPITIDLTTGNLTGSKTVIVSFSAYVAASSKAKDITILGKDFKIKFNPHAFYSSKLGDNRNKSNAGVRFKVSPYTGSTDLNMGDGTLLSTQYILEAGIYVGTDYSSIDYLSSNIEVTLDFDTAKAALRGIDNVSLSHYDGSRWSALSYAQPDDTAITASSYKLGRYMVIGRRNK